MLPRFEYGDEVRLTRNVRNDGTYPGLEMGNLLLRRGAVGYVRDVGSYLQDYIIYSVYFMEDDRLVGCREEELIPASDPWVPNRFEFRDKVRTTKALSAGGEIVVALGDEGEIQKVLRDAPGGIAYHVRLNGRTFQVPEDSLDMVAEASGGIVELPASGEPTPMEAQAMEAQAKEAHG
ncbi:MAG: nitrogen fixation protein NifZ [Gammaproteobacteria bacterium]